jgi:hypothetical protein
MPKNRIIIVIGVLIALLPMLGFPHSWESFFQILAGLSIILLSVWSTIDRKLKLQAKAQLRQNRRATDVSVVTPGVVPPVTPTFGKRVTDFYPKTGQPGRRVSDLKPTFPPPTNPEESEL